MMIKDRLKEFLKYLELGQNKFEAIVGISNGYIASKSITIASDIIEKIKSKYPELNTEWLITGNGNMLLVREEEERLCVPTAVLETLHRQAETIESQQRTIENLLKKTQIEIDHDDVACAVAK